MLTSRPELLWIGLSVAFINVVMETDTAGLELCQYIFKTAFTPPGEIMAIYYRMFTSLAIGYARLCNYRA